MAGTSISGRGNGSAENQKGPNNNRSYFNAENSPHCVCAGNVTIDGPLYTGGSQVVTLPESLPLSADNYVVLVTGPGGISYAAGKTDVDSKFTSFTVAIQGYGIAAWAVFTKGYCKEVSAIV